MSVKVVSDRQPFAVTEDWLFFPDRLVPVAERSDAIPLTGIAQSPLDQDFAVACALAEELDAGLPDTQVAAAAP